MTPLAALIAFAATVCVVPAAHAEPALLDVAQGTQPVHVAFAPGDRSRTFVVEQTGQIHIARDGVLLERPFLDLSSRVRAGGLRGLLSMAFAPNYERSRRFYVYFTDMQNRTRLEEYRRSRSDPEAAVPSSRRTVLTLNLPYDPAEDYIHLGGLLEFGPDGFLYLSTGDGGRGFVDKEISRAAQDRGSLFGKLLRIDPVARRGRYRIPDSNPYAGRTPGRGEVFAYGLRNPWRYSFNGDTIALADNGEARWEEVNLLSLKRARGANFGWPNFEARRRLKQGLRRSLVTFPDFAYPHNFDTVHGADCAGSVIGGYVVRDPKLPSLNGRYVYGDYCFQELRSFDPRRPNRSDRLELKISPPSSFGRDSRGRIYLVMHGGRIARLVEADAH